MAVVGQYDTPDGSVPINVVTVGGTAYVLTVATLTPLPNEPLDYRIRSLATDGTYGEPLAVEPPGTMISTGKFLVLTSPSATTSYQVRIIDPNALHEVGKFPVDGVGAIAGMDTTVIVSSGIYDITDPASPVRRDAPDDLPSSTLMGNGRLVAPDFEPSGDGSSFGIKVFDAATFEKTDDIEGRTPANVEVYATDGRRLCADLDSPDGSIICIDLDQDSTPRAVVATTTTVATTTVPTPLPTVAVTLAALAVIGAASVAHVERKVRRRGTCRPAANRPTRLTGEGTSRGTRQGGLARGQVRRLLRVAARRPL